MELLYFYIGEYKKVKNVGFNLSRLYDINYDLSSKTLTIKEDRKEEIKDYINERYGEIDVKPHTYKPIIFGTRTPSNKNELENLRKIPVKSNPNN